MQKIEKGTPVRCDCGKLVAIERDGIIYVLCKRCNRQVPLYREPRVHETESR